MRLDGKTAVVTGGSRGIGRAIAAGLSAAGADVVVTARSEQALADAVASLPGEAAWVAGSVRRADCPDRTVAAAMERFGSVDILVNNAAVNPYFGRLMGIEPSQMAATAEANQAAIVLLTQVCWQAWMQQHGGTVINIASIGGLVTEPGLGYYNATKAAVLHLTRQLAVELGPRVRVNAIAPGIVRTDMAKVLWEEHEHELRRTTPLGRIGEPRDIARAALFLASDQSSWCTGTTLVVDGGMSLVR